MPRLFVQRQEVVGIFHAKRVILKMSVYSFVIAREYDKGIRDAWCLLELRRYFPKEEGMMQHSTVGISLGDETKVIEPVGEPRNTT